MQYNDEKCENCVSLERFNKETIQKISQCFSTYLDGLFIDLSKAIMKKLEEQQQKIVKYQKLLNSFSEVLLSRSYLSETSRQNLVIQTERKRISSFKQAKDLMTVQKINQTIIKMQANILNLQGSLKRIQANPEAMGQTQSKLLKSNQSTLTSKISYLSSDKNYSVSCPERNQYEANSDKSCFESQIVKAAQRQTQQHASPTLKGNKMPLINKVNYLLHQLLPFCSDEDDANVIKFHLKKTYRKIDDIFQCQYKQPSSSNNVLIEQNYPQNIPSKFFASEYFSEKSFSNQSLVQWQQSLQNMNFGQCSIVGGLSATSESNMNSIKENYSSYKSKCMKQHDNSSVQSHGIAKNNVTEKICSIKKPKYFQRTSNQNKINMLKKKPKH